MKILIPWWAGLFPMAAILWVVIRMSNAPDLWQTFFGSGAGRSANLVGGLAAGALCLLMAVGRRGRHVVVLGVAGVYLIVAGFMALPSRATAPGLVARNTQPLMPVVAQVAPTALPTVAQLPTAQPATNSSDVGAAAVHVLGEVVEREQQQNRELANRPNTDPIVIGLIVVLFIVAVVVLTRRRGATESAPNIQISAPNSPEQLSDGVYAVVNGQVVKMGELPPKAKQKQFPNR